jgi:hypothetical protein
VSKCRAMHPPAGAAAADGVRARGQHSPGRNTQAIKAAAAAALGLLSLLPSNLQLILVLVLLLLLHDSRKPPPSIRAALAPGHQITTCHPPHTYSNLFLAQSVSARYCHAV